MFHLLYSERIASLLEALFCWLKQAEPLQSSCIKLVLHHRAQKGLIQIAGVQERPVKMKMCGQIVQESYGFWSARFDNSLSHSLEGPDFFYERLHVTDSICQRAPWRSFTSSGIVPSKSFSFYTGRWVQSYLGFWLNPKSSPRYGYYPLFCPVSPAKLLKAMGVELSRFSGAASGCGCNAAGTCAVWSANVGQMWGERASLAGEHSEDWLCKGYKKETYKLATALATILLKESKEMSNFARYLLLGKINPPQTL